MLNTTEWQYIASTKILHASLSPNKLPFFLDIFTEKVMNSAQKLLLAIVTLTITGSMQCMNGAVLKMPDERTLRDWLRTNSFNIFVRELKLEQTLANKHFTSEELTTVLLLARNEPRTRRTTLTSRDLKQRSPALLEALVKAYAIHN